MVRTLDNGNTQVEYHLREGMLWSDGEPVTSADCEFFHNLRMDPAAITMQRTGYPDVVESFEVVDELTFVLTYNTPWPDFNNTSYASCYLPAHIFADMLASEGNIDNHPYFSGENAVGYGPFVLDSWNVGQDMTFVQNPNWDGTVPAMDRLVIRFILESAQMLNAFEAGEVDIAFNFSDDFVPSYEEIATSDVFGTPGVFGDAIWFNVGNGGHPALEDVNVREALIHAVDRATLAENLVGPGTQVPKSWYPAQFWPEDLGFVDYDVATAESMLDAAGWSDSDGNGVRDDGAGTEMVLRFFTTDRQIRMDYQVVIQEYWAEIGVVAQILPVPANILFGSFLERGILNTGDFDVAIFALSASPLTPFADAPSWFGCEGTPSAENPNGNNGWGWCDPEYDALDLLVGQTVDSTERLGYAQDAIRHFLAGQFWHGLYLRQTWFAASTSVFNTETLYNMGTLSGNYFNQIENWELAG
jgi:peptide/nickel transport system substrate-binding protein